MINNLKLPEDPFNIIITGVGGQGNVTASRILGNILIKKGFFVTIGETFGASQRGGSVTSHIRVSCKSVWSPLIPKGKAHLIVSLEPTETIKAISTHGNSKVITISNTRPIYSVRVIAGEQEYPSLTEIKSIIKEFTSRSFFINATEEALKLGLPILANVIMIGAVGGMEILPLTMADYKDTIAANMSKDKLKLNLKAYELGESIIRKNIA